MEGRRKDQAVAAEYRARLALLPLGRFDSRLASDAADRARARVYLTETLPREIPEASVATTAGGETLPGEAPAG